ncbi:MAG TPA: hypothetical protein VF736_10215 [Pyrinomonadaceae bacterium]|jgi:hypothetical protein
MPVIGRLDGQVEEVIIKPVSGRRREDPPPETTEAGRAPAPPPSAPVQTPNSDESSPEAEELPVWLL